MEGGPSIEGALIKKLITCSDSAVVEAYKVLDNNVAINRFLRIWESKEGMEGGGELIERPLKTQTRLSPAKNHLEF